MTSAISAHDAEPYQAVQKSKDKEKKERKKKKSTSQQQDGDIYGWLKEAVSPGVGLCCKFRSNWRASCSVLQICVYLVRTLCINLRGSMDILSGEPCVFLSHIGLQSEGRAETGVGDFSLRSLAWMCSHSPVDLPAVSALQVGRRVVGFVAPS